MIEPGEIDINQRFRDVREDMRRSATDLRTDLRELDHRISREVDAIGRDRKDLRDQVDRIEDKIDTRLGRWGAGAIAMIAASPSLILLLTRGH